MDKVTEWSSILFSRNLELAVGGGRRSEPGHARRHTSARQRSVRDLTFYPQELGVLFFSNLAGNQLRVLSRIMILRRGTESAYIFGPTCLLSSVL